MKLEYKRFSLNLKSLQKRQFEGYLSTFGNVDHGGDIVVRGAFKRTLSEHKEADELPPMFWMHDPRNVPGKWLDMDEDDKGLFVKGELADTPLGNEMHTLLGMKAVRGMSIGYTVEERDWDKEGHRLLKDIELWEGSIVSMAMNPKASITAAKSRLSLKGEYVPEPAEFKRKLEEHLRDVGCSISVAKRLVAKMYSETSETDDPLLDEGADGDDETSALMESMQDLTAKLLFSNIGK